jgi:hypothetical protein
MIFFNYHTVSRTTNSWPAVRNSPTILEENLFGEHMLRRTAVSSMCFYQTSGFSGPATSLTSHLPRLLRATSVVVHYTYVWLYRKSLISSNPLWNAGFYPLLLLFRCTDSVKYGLGLKALCGLQSGKAGQDQVENPMLMYTHCYTHCSCNNDRDAFSVFWFVF